MAAKTPKINARDAPETAPPPFQNRQNPKKLQHFNSVNGKKGRVLVKIVLSVEIEGNK